MQILTGTACNRQHEDTMDNRKKTVILSFAMQCAAAAAQDTSPADTVASVQALDGVVVTATSGTRSKFRIENTEVIGQSQLVRAACCNLGESFTTNPSVDVSYPDAATGARQIKLLGLSGTYVQMLAENMPALRGAALPYALGYVPGPWMQSIQVSKGAASVKNGYESITGQINVEYLKPQATDGVRVNGYLDSYLRQEANADASVHLSDRLSTSLLLHFENRQRDHDGNGDGFMDMPKLRQYNLMHRWAYMSPGFISQLSLRALRDERQSGMSHKAHQSATMPMYGISTRTDRYEMQWKNALILNPERNASIALMLHGSWHDVGSRFGSTTYDVTQKNGYAQLMFETDLSQRHALALGASLNHDHYTESGNMPLVAASAYESGWGSPRSETTAGLYAQYTYKPSDGLSIMPGLRWDHSSHYGAFLTPRLHIRYSPWDVLTLRASAGKGYRTPHAMAENAPLLASGRTFSIAGPLKQEEAWNFGLSAGWALPIGDKTLELNMEYFYTDFSSQMVVSVDGVLGAHTVSLGNLAGSSYSHTAQIDATYPLLEGLTATAAFRYTDARTTYDGILRHRPLTSRFKGLLTLSYSTPLELWRFDVTGQVNGHGELYDRSPYPTYFQLQAQATRDFPRFSIYIGGENLTNYRISNPIINASNPWSAAFDATQAWGPTDGAMAYIGFRLKLEKP